MLGMAVSFGSHHFCSTGCAQYLMLRSTLVLVMVEHRLQKWGTFVQIEQGRMTVVNVGSMC